MSPPPLDSRVFAALVPPEEVAMAMVDQMEGWDLPGRLVPPSNWHITLRFAGVIDEATWDRWVAALDTDVQASRQRIRLAGVGAFPNPRKATVLWMGVEAARLGDLAAQVDEAAQAAGLAPEERPFHPHLTLARVRPPKSVGGLIQSVVPLDLSWMASEYHLMAAVGSHYRRFETFSFG